MGIFADGIAQQIEAFALTTGEWLGVLTPLIEDVSRVGPEGIQALASDPASCTAKAIRNAVGRRDYDDALARTFAGASIGESIDAEQMSMLVPCVPHTDFAIVLIAIAEGERADALVRRHRGERAPEIPAGTRPRACARDRRARSSVALREGRRDLAGVQPE